MPVHTTMSSRVHVLPAEETDTNVEHGAGAQPEPPHNLTNVACAMSVECVLVSEWPLHFCAVAGSDVICSDFLFTARPFRAIVR